MQNNSNSLRPKCKTCSLISFICNFKSISTHCTDWNVLTQKLINRLKSIKIIGNIILKMHFILCLSNCKYYFSNFTGQLITRIPTEPVRNVGRAKTNNEIE